MNNFKKEKIYNLFYRDGIFLRKKEFSELKEAKIFAFNGEILDLLLADCITDSNNRIITVYVSEKDLKRMEFVKSRIGQYFNLAGD